ncbi:MAG: hypothetical protein LBF27_09125 [Sphingobacterium sp.]|jgi:acyl carrier protein|nr:hypothetical protein [Sphingobacterium sp.]
MMADDELENVDPDDISDLLVKLEKSFDMKFESTELMHIFTFGELCDHITNKIQLAHSNDCTSQQAFYKLRDAMASILQIDYKTITTSSALLTNGCYPNWDSIFKSKKWMTKVNAKTHWENRCVI